MPQDPSRSSAPVCVRMRLQGSIQCTMISRQVCGQVLVETDAFGSPSRQLDRAEGPAHRLPSSGDPFLPAPAIIASLGAPMRTDSSDSLPVWPTSDISQPPSSSTLCSKAARVIDPETGSRRGSETSASAVRGAIAQRLSDAVERTPRIIHAAGQVVAPASLTLHQHGQDLAQPASQSLRRRVTASFGNGDRRPGRSTVP